LGEAVEAAFLAKATMLGFPVLKPWGDSRPYDLGWTVGGGCGGAGEMRDQLSRHAMRREGERQRGLYTLDDIDFLAAYVIKKDLWYIVRRMRLCRGRRCTLIMVRGARDV